MPTYNPTVVYGTWPYPAYPPVYIPPPPGYAIATGLATGLAFGVGIAITNSLWGGFNWNSHDVTSTSTATTTSTSTTGINANNTTTHWNRNDPQFNRNVDRSNRQANVNTGNIGSGNREQPTSSAAATTRAPGAQTLSRAPGRTSAVRRASACRTSARAANARTRRGGWRAPESRRGGRCWGCGRDRDLQQRAQGVNRDNALRGAGDGDAARRDMQRGQASRDQLANRGGGGGQPRSGWWRDVNSEAVAAVRGRGIGGGGGGMRGGGGGFGGGHGGGMRRR